jgi:hypothetical protein
VNTASSHTQETDYERRANAQLAQWQTRMLRQPGLFSWVTEGLQAKTNRLIPERAHEAVTGFIKQMTRAVLSGSDYTAPLPLRDAPLSQRERQVVEKIEFYKRSAAAEGGITGAGGIFLGLADFPLLLTIKFKLLFDTAALYGHSGTDYRERLYILHIMQLAFSSDTQRRKIYMLMRDWPIYSARLPASLDEFDWRAFQQEYRNYIDIPKLLQLIPVIGAPVGAVVNYQLLAKLGDTAVNAYRMRWFAQQ